MKGFILAAGFGTRLWPLTEDRTKAAISFLNRPLITYAVEYLASHGITDLIINLHHQPESIRYALGDGSALGVNIEYSNEDEILGTSGALDRVRASLLDDDFVVINGKIATNIGLGKVIESHRKSQAIATLVLKKNIALEHFSIVEVDEHNQISRFAGFPDEASGQVENSKRHSEAAPLMFTGIQVLSPRIFKYIPRNCFSHSTIHVYPQAIAAGEKVIGLTSDADWYEMSTLQRYLEAHLKLMTSSSVVCGRNCIIDPSATVEQSVLWDNVKIESGARVSHSVLADGVRIPAGATIDRAVVVRRAIVRQLERGEIVGDNVIVPV
ncbi:MAG TPA: NDP-sugar synthase [Blastocatellia bacterium]|nr:NDP-sugar synthase [Blastocatellia bacterium]